MRSVLAGLELISAIPAANPNPTTAGTDEAKGGRRPPGDLGYVVYARWYGPPFHTPTSEHRGCRSDSEREDCLTAAKRELEHLRKGPGPQAVVTETPEQTRRRMLTETTGWSLDDVARSHWRTSPTVMRRLRVADGRHADTGKPVDTTEHMEALDLASRARELRDTGMSYRAIALALRVHPTQVTRLLKRVA